MSDKDFNIFICEDSGPIVTRLGVSFTAVKGETLKVHRDIPVKEITDSGLVRVTQYAEIPPVNTDTNHELIELRGAMQHLAEQLTSIKATADLVADLHAKMNTLTQVVAQNQADMAQLKTGAGLKNSMKSPAKSSAAQPLNLEEELDA